MAQKLGVSDMLEYVFFDEGVRERFVGFLREHGVATVLSEADGLIAAIPEDIDDTLSDAIDACYDRLLQENAELLESSEGGLEKQAAGVRVQLADGTPCMVRLAPALMARLLNCITLEELRDMVQAIALQVEDPDDLPVCHSREPKVGS